MPYYEVGSLELLSSGVSVETLSVEVDGSDPGMVLSARRKMEPRKPSTMPSGVKMLNPEPSDIVISLAGT